MMSNNNYTSNIKIEDIYWRVNGFLAALPATISGNKLQYNDTNNTRVLYE